MKVRVTNKHKNKPTAFTLAEVLVTLTIIGVIAALTIPALIQNVQDAQYKTAYKKAYANVNQAFLRAKNDYEFIDINGIGTVVTNIRTLEKYFSVTKTCTNSITQGCWVDNCINGDNDCLWSTPAENSQGTGEGFIDNSGMEWIHYKPLALFIMLVDTNGNKPPNRVGRDRFVFLFEDKDGNTNVYAPTQIKLIADVTAKTANLCTFGNCYFTGWLEQ